MALALAAVALAPAAAVLARAVGVPARAVVARWAVARSAAGVVESVMRVADHRKVHLPLAPWDIAVLRLQPPRAATIPTPPQGSAGLLRGALSSILVSQHWLREHPSVDRI